MKKICRRGTILLMCIMLLSVQAAAVEQLIPVGKVIGIELFDGSVTVAAIDETLGGSARAAGLQVGDKILRVDQKEITCARDVRCALDRSDVQVELTVERKGKVETLQLHPQVTPDGPRLGIYLRQGITGVGTVTWYDPDTGAFGALGHGVNTQSGDLLPMEKGNIYAATVAGVNKGEPGKPGQLLGALEGETPVGTLTENTAQGIFGKALRDWEGQAIPVGEEQDVQTGQAQILSTVSDGQTQTYCVEILKVYPNAGNTGRNMLLRVTDPALLSTTGGIVQGMGVSYNKDNQDNSLACRGVWCQSRFSLTTKIQACQAQVCGTESTGFCYRDARAKSRQGGLYSSIFDKQATTYSCHTGCRCRTGSVTPFGIFSLHLK